MFFFDNEDAMIENLKNSTALERITIKGLFGRNNITLHFNKEVNIYIGENGLGKTTILNCVYYILHGDYEKLAGVPFDSIIVKLRNEQDIKITKADVVKYVDTISTKRSIRYREIYPFIEELLEQYNFSSIALLDDDIQERISIKLSRMYGMPYSQAYSFVMSYITSDRKLQRGNEQNIIKLRDLVTKSINERVIYLTTYRRIEKDYSEYFNPDKERYHRMEDDALIRFGMKDVSKAINDILGVIKDKTNQGFNKMTGILLSKYVNLGSNIYKHNQHIDNNLLKIVLDRLGQQINDNDKTSILDLVSSGEIYNSEYQYLRDLIGELIHSYNQLMKYDEKIMMFKDTCNRYLNDKEFVYNQSDITLKLFLNHVDNKRKDEVELSMLSSGEKQIVSLFSRLYLESDKKCILLIDEPELSISMRWQKMLLPDIMRSDNCKLLLTVTHSPFIFENEFDEDAQDMWHSFDHLKRN